jgi:hypothetical protein
MHIFILKVFNVNEKQKKNHSISVSLFYSQVISVNSLATELKIDQGARTLQENR